ncbi:hypothetical protein PLICRDRAFT_128176 [Plicaturopsis crispa FD-325 SS-3]|nr:hypothetical protein PLICRDRAFT_128176 [Plicaturopsis crispa FD-325 SS-3]
MSALSTWQQAWDTAQPRISSIRDSLNSISPPSPRVVRVGQLDSELLDQELVHLLQEPLTKSLSLVNSSLKARFEPELALLIQLILYKLSIWNIGASYGAKLQDLRYTIPRTSGRSLAPSGLPRRTLLIHGALTVVLPYLHTRIRAHALSRAWPDAPSSDRRRRIWDTLTALESSHSLLTLLSFIAFLWNGRYRTITDRILRMSLVPSRRLVKRDVSYEFMNRQMVWHAFTEFLLFLLPLVSARGVRRRFARLTSRINVSSLLPAPAQSALGLSGRHEKGAPSKRGKYWSLSQDQCAICAENASFNLNLSDPTNAFTSLATPAFPPSSSDASPEEHAEDDSAPPTYPIHTPYATSCGHIYCYHCIAERMMRTADEALDDSGWECLRCTAGVTGADRAEGVAEEEVSESGDDYYFTSDMDVTDVSGSVGSYSESGLSDD